MYDPDEIAVKIGYLQNLQDIQEYYYLPVVDEEGNVVSFADYREHHNQT